MDQGFKGLRLYNTLTHAKEDFVPLDAANVRFYVCGPTVYDYAHIGNARPAIVFDVLFRLLRHLYGEAHVRYVRNITDVDDKINARAAQEGISIRELTERTADQYHADVEALGVLRPTVEPRATEHIGQMTAMIGRLVESGHAYLAENHVLFSVPSMPDYGKLSRRSLDEMQAGARVDVAPYKRDPMDFVLWKPSKPGEPSWPSPNGIVVEGRPGWHIECSAMAEQHLGEVFDIHGGGIDLVFPHHENELAQSRCAHGTRLMAKYWMHNGFLQVEGQKMSKSLGNFVTIRELLDEGWAGETLRLNMLRTHYRQPIDWSERSLEESSAIVQSWYSLFEDTHPDANSEVDSEILSYLLDDLNTPSAIARLQSISSDVMAGSVSPGTFYAAAKAIGLEGVFANRPGERVIYSEEAHSVASGLILDRDKARSKRDFIAADYYRNAIFMLGYRVSDLKDGPSELTRLEKPAVNLSGGLKGKLAALVKAARASVAYTDAGSMGFSFRQGQTFFHTEALILTLEIAFEQLEKEIGSGLCSESELKDTVLDLCATAIASPAMWTNELISIRVMERLLSGTISSTVVYFPNRSFRVSGDALSIGDVSIRLTASVLESAPALVARTLDRDKSNGMPSSVFSVRVYATSSTKIARGSMLVNAFVSAARIILILSEVEDVIYPRSGIKEKWLFDQKQDKIISHSGSGWSIGSVDIGFPYMLSHEAVRCIERSPYKARFDQYVELSRTGMPSPQLIVLDRLTRARSADDYYERVLWNLEAIRILLGARHLASVDTVRVRDVVGGQGKQVARLERAIARVSEAVRRPRLVGGSDAQIAQDLAEGLVVHRLQSGTWSELRDPDELES